ncbi:hypothetical protein [Liquorilactobacillus mali]|uniref:hypothetical protein n=1 Tax=Liquorilactobacillus mali TaxID=1618 RepID=UPI0002492009|nr:hypothetical protein [Liquorilactobacillus mali]
MEEIHLNNSVQEAHYILKQVKKYFKPGIKARYYILVVNDRFDHTFNFFFNIFKPKHFSRSIPLHRIKCYSLDYLENLIKELQQETQLTINFVLFENQRWPSTNQLISYKRSVKD